MVRDAETPIVVETVCYLSVKAIMPVRIGVCGRDAEDRGKEPSFRMTGDNVKQEGREKNHNQDSEASRNNTMKSADHHHALRSKCGNLFHLQLGKGEPGSSMLYTWTQLT